MEVEAWHGPLLRKWRQHSQWSDTMLFDEGYSLQGPNPWLVQCGFSQMKERQKALCPRRKLFAPSLHLRMFLNCRYATVSVWSFRQQMWPPRSPGYARQSRPVFNK